MSKCEMRRYSYIQLATPLALKAGDIFHEGVPPSFIQSDWNPVTKKQDYHHRAQPFDELFLNLFEAEAKENFFLRLYMVVSKKQVHHALEITMFHFSGAIKLRTFHFPRLQYVTLKFD